MARSREADPQSDGDSMQPIRAVWLRASTDSPVVQPADRVPPTQRPQDTAMVRPEPAPTPPRFQSAPDRDADGHRTPGAKPSLDDVYPDSVPHFDGRPPRRQWVWLVAAAAVVLVGSFIYGVLAGPTDPVHSGDEPIGVAQPWPEDSAAGTTLPGLSFEPVEPTPTATSLMPMSPPALPVTTPAASQPAGAGAVVGTTGPKPTTAAASTATAAVTFQGVSGYGCANDSARNWYSYGQDGSWLAGGGGYSGCGGGSLALPTSGDPGSDTDEYVVWWFETGPVTTGSCAVQVYVPSSGNAMGQPAYYKILGGRTSSTVMARFTIDQTANRGRWVSAGTYPVSAGAISIHLGNRGPSGSYLGAGQARVSCTAG